MTQPIQEPLTQRSITKAAWRESQLERRPAQREGAGEWAYIFRNDDLTVADSTYTLAHANANGSDTSNSGLFEIDATVGFIDIMVAGIYLATFHGQWSGVLNTQLSEWIYWNGGSERTVTTTEPLIAETNSVVSGGGTAEFDSRFFSLSDWRLIPVPMDVASLADPPLRVRAAVRHESGGNRTLDESELFIVRLGAYP